MAHHIFDVRRSETRDLVAAQLRELADEFAHGKLELAYEELHSPTEIAEPVNVMIDLKQGRHQVDLMIHLSWPTPHHPDHS